jgi:hypothetical protein
MRRSKAPSFDDLVGDGKQRRRHTDAKRPGGLEVDYEFEFRHLHHGEIGRLCTFENSGDIGADLRIDLPANNSVADQAAGRGESPARVDRGQAVTALSIIAPQRRSIGIATTRLADFSSWHRNTKDARGEHPGPCVVIMGQRR